MKKDIKVVVFSNDSCASYLPDTPAEFIRWWEEKFNLCPLEYREKLKVDCTTSTYYDCSCLEVDIYYYRPETDEEYNNRLKKEQQAAKLRESQLLDELGALRKNIAYN